MGDGEKFSDLFVYVCHAQESDCYFEIFHFFFLYLKTECNSIFFLKKSKDKKKNKNLKTNKKKLILSSDLFYYGQSFMVKNGLI